MEYNGYSLFNDVQDQELQARNRAVVLWNIYETNSQEGRTSPRGVADMAGYLKSVPEDERAPVLDKLQAIQDAQVGTA